MTAPLAITLTKRGAVPLPTYIHHVQTLLQRCQQQPEQQHVRFELPRRYTARQDHTHERLELPRVDAWLPPEEATARASVTVAPFSLEKRYALGPPMISQTASLEQMLHEANKQLQHYEQHYRQWSMTFVDTSDIADVRVRDELLQKIAERVKTPLGIQDRRYALPRTDRGYLPVSSLPKIVRVLRTPFNLTNPAVLLYRADPEPNSKTVAQALSDIGIRLETTHSHSINTPTPYRLESFKTYLPEPDLNAYRTAFIGAANLEQMYPGMVQNTGRKDFPDDRFLAWTLVIEDNPDLYNAVIWENALHEQILPNLYKSLFRLKGSTAMREWEKRYRHASAAMFKAFEYGVLHTTAHQASKIREFIAYYEPRLAGIEYLEDVIMAIHKSLAAEVPSMLIDDAAFLDNWDDLPLLPAVDAKRLLVRTATELPQYLTELRFEQ